MLPDSRTCRKCGADKPLSEFSKAPRGKYGRKSSCKECDAARHRALHPPQPRRRPSIDVDAARAKLERENNGPRTCTKCAELKPADAFSPRGERYGVVLRKSKCKQCSAAQARDWYSRNTEQGLTNRRRLLLKQHYGLTPEEYEDLLATQGGVCAICRNPETAERNGKTMRLPVDHCHGTGRIRGLLCHRCNRAIGLLRDDVDLLAAAIDYLKKGSDSN